jgi:hypothetical protein
MAGRQLENRMWAEIDKMGGLDGIVQRIGDGGSLAKMAEELGVSRTFLSWKVNQIPGMKERMKQARRLKADAFADQAMAIADEVSDTNPVAVAKARGQIEVRKWLAAVNDPETYGVQKPGVTISIGNLHLDALRQVSVGGDDEQTLDAEALDGDATSWGVQGGQEA